MKRIVLLYVIISLALVGQETQKYQINSIYLATNTILVPQSFILVLSKKLFSSFDMDNKTYLYPGINGGMVLNDKHYLNLYYTNASYFNLKDVLTPPKVLPYERFSVTGISYLNEFYYNHFLSITIGGGLCYLDGIKRGNYLYTDRVVKQVPLSSTYSYYYIDIYESNHIKNIGISTQCNFVIFKNFWLQLSNQIVGMYFIPSNTYYFNYGLYFQLFIHWKKNNNL
ncbi:MAG: hypothetical protein KatS3mg027_2462 [Bacteroidia bacterium]|nr:MAG: hypothetical protein KatS3mg027_2462 [Bacteroidia bacterium]